MIPRFCRDHRRPEAIKTASYLRALIERWNLDPRDAAVRASLRDLGAVDLDLQVKPQELAVVRGRANGKKAARRLERDMAGLRKARIGLERHLATFATRWTRRRIEDENRDALRRAEVGGGIR
jgi:hypothetical protein